MSEDQINRAEVARLDGCVSRLLLGLQISGGIQPAWISALAADRWLATACRTPSVPPAAPAPAAVGAGATAGIASGARKMPSGAVGTPFASRAQGASRAASASAARLRCASAGRSALAWEFSDPWMGASWLSSTSKPVSYCSFRMRRGCSPECESPLLSSRRLCACSVGWSQSGSRGTSTHE